MAHRPQVWHGLGAVVVGLLAMVIALGQTADPPTANARASSPAVDGVVSEVRSYGCGVPLLAREERQLAAAYRTAAVTREQLRVAGRIDGAGLLINEGVGQSQNFWAYNFVSQSYYQVPSTLRRVTTRAYIYLANDQSVPEDALDTLAQRWETIYATTTGVFGAAPDLDGDSRVTLLLADLMDSNSARVQGYFTLRNQFPSAPFSNAREMIYLDTSPTSVNSTAFLGALAHELAHLINWNFHRDSGGQELWLNEGLAELSRYRNGFGHSASAGFFSNPDKQLTRWAPGQENLASSYLFMLYFWEQFGDAGINQIVRHFGVDVDAVEGALRALGRTEKLADVFHRWTIANFLDDTSLSGGIYGYRTLDLVTGEYDGITTFPRAYRTTEFIPPAGDSGTVQHWAARYYRFYGKTGVLSLDFLGNDYNTFRIAALASSSTDFRSGNAVFAIPLNAAQDGGLALADFGTAYPAAVLVVSAVGETGGSDYAFSAAVGVTAPAATPTPTPFPAGFGTPTPAATAASAQATPTAFSLQPTPTTVAGVPTATPYPGWTAVPTTCCLPSVWFPTLHPSPYDFVTIYGRLIDGAGRPVPGATMETLWYFGDSLTPSLCVSAPTNADGMTTCTVAFSGQAAVGRAVPVRARFLYGGQTYTINTSITPR